MKHNEQTPQEEEKRIKNNGFIDAWKNAINGIIYATTTQGNVKKQLVIAVIVVIISLFFKSRVFNFFIYHYSYLICRNGKYSN